MRMLLNCGEVEKSFRQPIASWTKQNNTPAQVTYGAKTLDELLSKAKVYQVDIIVVSCDATLYNLVGKNKGTHQDWAGSVLWEEVPILIINPLNHVKYRAIGHWLLQMHLGKIPRIVKKKKPERFNWRIVTKGDQAREAVTYLKAAAYLVEDIETSRQNGITSISFTPIFEDLTIGTTWVFNLSQKDLCFLHDYCRIINDLPIPKVFHNGGFDAFHLCRWYQPPRNYTLDTEYMWKCWHAEARMSLDFVANTVLYDARYWKYEAAKEPMKYNALDTINTARIFLYLLEEMPAWAWKNYSKLVPNIAPVVWTEFEGFKADMDRLLPIRERALAEKKKLREELVAMSGEPDFNPGSAKQVSAWLYDVLRAKKLAQRGAKKQSSTSTDTKTLARVALQHPLFARIIGTLLEYRALSTAISTFYLARLTPGDRLMFSLNLAGTSTGRFSCNSSSLYAPMLDGQTLSSQQNYGAQLQNIPPYMKVALRADEGFRVINIDKSKSEAYCVAKISKDKVFEADLKGKLDFYLALGNRLFGLEIKDKGDPLRQIFKKINHSSSYMAGGESLLSSIGPATIFQYMHTLKWKGTALGFATHCITSLHKTYKRRQEWWDETRTFVKNFGYIDTPDGWRREVFCYGRHEVPHATLRAIVAHQPQHLSVAGLNEAFWKVWYNIQLPSNGDFRLKGQVHDSMVAQAKAGAEEFYADRVMQEMDIVQPTDFGDLRIPLDLDITTYWKDK